MMLLRTLKVSITGAKCPTQTHTSSSVCVSNVSRRVGMATQHPTRTPYPWRCCSSDPQEQILYLFENVIPGCVTVQVELCCIWVFNKTSVCWVAAANSCPDPAVSGFLLLLPWQPFRDSLLGFNWIRGQVIGSRDSPCNSVGGAFVYTGPRNENKSHSFLWNRLKFFFLFLFYFLVLFLQKKTRRYNVFILYLKKY